jgi:hypothetical protein
MAIKFERIEPGMELCDCHRYTMGNTTMRRWGLWRVQVVSVDKEARTAVVSWNDNAPQAWHERRLVKLYREPPKKYTEQSRLFG